MSYNPLDWYWIVATNPSQRWAGARGIYVATSDSAYVSWDAIDGNDATNIDTEAHLWDVISQIALSIYLGGTGRGLYTNTGGVTDIVLTNPITDILNISFTADGHTVTFPYMNLPVSRPIGVPIVINNLDAAVTFTVRSFDGDLVATVYPLHTVTLYNTSFASPIGVFRGDLQWTTVPDSASANKMLITGSTANAPPSASITLDADTALTSNSDTRIATQKAVKAYADAIGIAGSGDFHGPTSSALNDPVVYADTTGKLGKDISYSTFKTNLSLVKGDVGLGNVDNTADTAKPVSTAQQTALDAKQPLDSDLTTIAGLTATTDNFLQSKSSAWASRTIAQVKTDLGLTGTNSGDQTITLTGDVTGSGTGSFAITLANIPTATPAVGTILHTNIAAPSTPASGKDSVWTDTTDKRLHDKNDAGTIGTTVVADTGASNNFLTAISMAGVISKAQPAFTNLSGSVAASQMPALTGDVTTSAGAVATTIANSAVTNAKSANMANSTIKGRTTAGRGIPEDLTAAQAAAIIGSVGGALKSKILSFTRGMTAASGTVAYTGFGFTPTSCIALAFISTITESSVGLSDSVLGNMVMGTSATTPNWTGNSAQFIRLVDATVTNNQSAVLTSYDADGLTLTWTKDGSPTGTATIYILGLR